MKPNLKFIHICILFISALLLIGCTAPTEVEVPREVVVTRVVESFVEVPAPANGNNKPTNNSDSQLISIPYTVDTYPNEIIVETMKSDAFAEAFRIYTILPLSYQENPDKQYQTIYIMEANFDIHQANYLIWNLGYLDLIPDLIIVGVGYDINSQEELVQLRQRDLMPPKFNAGTGGADDLLAFMQNELIPYIDTTYRTNPDKRFLYGAYEAGAFVIYTVLNQTELFTGYIANTPFLEGWSAFEHLKEYTDNHTDLAASLFVTVHREFANLPDELITVLNEQNYENLKLKYVVYEDENVLEMGPVGMQRGFREIFRSSLWANE